MKKQHLASNDFPCHSKVKKGAKRISVRNMRNRLKRELEKEKHS